MHSPGANWYQQAGFAPGISRLGSGLKMDGEVSPSLMAWTG